MTRIDRALAHARAAIGGDGAYLDAQLLLAQVLGRSRAWLFAHADDEIAPAALQAFDALVGQRADGVPIAYLLGERAFWSLSLRVSPAVLIPRPETELLVELALARIATGVAAHVVDLGTGSGAVALALASERPQARIVATDASAAALEVARGNAQRLGLANVEFVMGNWCAPLAGRRFDVIASNPPYIAAADGHLAQGDLRFEPLSALASGDDGLDAIRAIVVAAPGCLNRGGWLLFEHGAGQGAAVRELLEQRGFSHVETARDLEQRERVTLGRWPADADSAR